MLKAFGPPPSPCGVGGCLPSIAVTIPGCPSTRIAPLLQLIFALQQRIVLLLEATLTFSFLKPVANSALSGLGRSGLSHTLKEKRELADRQVDTYHPCDCSHFGECWACAAGQVTIPLGLGGLPTRDTTLQKRIRIVFTVVNFSEALNREPF